MVVLCEVVFSSGLMLKQALAALKEVSSDIKFDFVKNKKGKRGITCRLNSTGNMFMCEYYLPAENLNKFEMSVKEHSFTFSADTMLKVLRSGESQDYVTLRCESGKGSMTVQIDHLTPPPARTMTYEIDASATVFDEIGSPPMNQLSSWPYQQINAGDFQKSVARIADAIKSRSKGESLTHVIASNLCLSMDYQDDQNSFGYQMKKYETGNSGLPSNIASQLGGGSTLKSGSGDQMELDEQTSLEIMQNSLGHAISESVPFLAYPMKQSIHEGYYNIHFLMTVAKGGKCISDCAHLVFPVANDKMKIMGAIYTLESQLQKVQEFDRKMKVRNEKAKSIRLENSMMDGFAQSQDVNDLLNMNQYGGAFRNTGSTASSTAGSTGTDGVDAVFGDQKEIDKIIDLQDDELEVAEEGSIAQKFRDARKIIRKLDVLIKKSLDQKKKAQESMDSIDGPIMSGMEVDDGEEEDVDGANFFDETQNDPLDKKSFAKINVTEKYLESAVRVARTKLKALMDQNGENRLTLKQLQHLRSAHKQGPLLDVIIQACNVIAVKFPDLTKKFVFKREPTKRNLDSGYLAYFLVSADKPRVNEMDDSSSDSESDEEKKQSKIKDYWLFNRQQYLGHEKMQRTDKIRNIVSRATGGVDDEISVGGEKINKAAVQVKSAELAGDLFDGADGDVNMGEDVNMGAPEVPTKKKAGKKAGAKKAPRAKKSAKRNRAEMEEELGDEFEIK